MGGRARAVDPGVDARYKALVQDADLVQRAAEGDLEAFTLLVESRRERVFWIACHVVGDFELARDVAQEVFLRLFRVIRRFRKGGRFDAWLYRITLHLAIDAARRERPHRQAGNLADLGEGSEPRGPAAAEGLREREVRRIFADLATRLGPKQRAAFVLREIEGMSTGEVAAVLGTTESTVRNHILQARRLLKEGLTARFPEYAPKNKPR
jgi:RNA polymerase sigma-70 factor (ECF subfamily)